MGCSTASALTCFASGGSSEGKLKLRSMRSCAPEWRCIFMRIAAVGTLKSVAPMLIGNRAGALDPSGPQVGHSKKVTSTIAPVPSAHPTITGIMWLLEGAREPRDRKSTRLNSSHVEISYAVFCLKKKKSTQRLGQRVDVRACS